MSTYTAEQLLSTKGLAEYLDVPVQTVNRWRYTHTGPPGYKVGRFVRYRRADIEVWLAERADKCRTAS